MLYRSMQKKWYKNVVNQKQIVDLKFNFRGTTTDQVYYLNNEQLAANGHFVLNSHFVNKHNV